MEKSTASENWKFNCVEVCNEANFLPKRQQDAEEDWDLCEVGVGANSVIVKFAHGTIQRRASS